MAASSGAVRAGGAFIELFANDKLLHAALNRAKRAVQAFGAFIGKAGTGLATAGGLLLAPLTALFTGGVKYAAELDDLADSFATTTEKLSPLAGAFKVAGLSLEDLGKALEKAADNANGSPVEVALIGMIEELDKIPDAGKRATAFLEEFGKSGKKLSSIAPDIRRLMANSPLISSQEAKAAEKSTQDFAAALLKLQVAMLPIIIQIGPLITRVSEFAQQNAGVVRSVTQLAAIMLGAGLALKVLSPAFAILAAGIGVAISALVTLKALLLALISLPGLLLVGVIALASALGKGGTFQGALGQLGDGFRNLAEIGKETFSGIAAAWRSGDLELVAKIALAGIEEAWAQMLIMMEQQWIRFKEKFVDGFHEIWGEMKKDAKTFNPLEFLGMPKADADRKFKELGIDPGKVRNDEAERQETEKRRRDAARRVAMNELKIDLDAAKKRKDALVAEARAKELMPKIAKFATAFAGGMGGMSADDIERRQAFEFAKNRHMEELPMPREALSRLADSVKGAFDSPNFAQTLGIADDISQRQLDAMERQEEIQKQLLEALKGLPIMRFA